MSGYAHERRVAIAEARAAISVAVGKVTAQHDLTYAETLLVLAEETAAWASCQMNAELRAEEGPRDTPGLG